ncbi:outer membrane receptor for ferrienterochelin and colicin [Kluyvera sp. 1366]
MKIALLRQASLLMLPAMLPVSALAANAASNTMVVSAAPSASGLSELDTPAAVSVVSGDDMRHAAPRVNLSENLSSVPGLQIQNRQNFEHNRQSHVQLSCNLLINRR